MPKKIDLTGQPFGRLIVIREDGVYANGDIKWLCKCECGRIRHARTYTLTHGQALSCGCLKREIVSKRFTKHGLTKSYPRVYDSVKKHFRDINLGRGTYSLWSIDPRYTERDGVARFIYDLVSLYPEECARYEVDRTLVLDKDSDPDKILRPDSVRFVTAQENVSHRSNTVLVLDTPLSVVCRDEGIMTLRDKEETPEYKHIRWAWVRHQKIHPILWNARKQNLEKEERLLEMTKLKVRRAELMIEGLKKLTTSKSDTLDARYC